MEQALRDLVTCGRKPECVILSTSSRNKSVAPLYAFLGNLSGLVPDKVSCVHSFTIAALDLKMKKLKVGKKRFGKPITALDVELEPYLREEKMLTATWYRKMSGEMPWKLNEKHERNYFPAKFLELEQRIAKIQSHGNAEWFASLPFEKME